MERRELFSSLANSFKKEQKQERVIRPPYYESLISFDKDCLGCETKECSSFCEENIVFIDDEGKPYLNFKDRGCTYCDECAIHCPNEVLTKENKKQIDVKIEIDVLKCMSWHSTMCFSCKDPCLDDAIEFLGIFKPSINPETCTSCGFCISVCPSEAIKLV